MRHRGQICGYEGRVGHVRSVAPADPLLALRRAIAAELAFMAFEAKREL